MNFGKRIKEARKEAGLTQEQLGLKCGWSSGNPQSRIGNYEKDVRAPSAADLALIADAVDKNILYFYGQDSRTPTAPTDDVDIKSLAVIIEKHPDDVKLLHQAIQIVEDALMVDNHPYDSEVKAKAIITALHLALTSEDRSIDKRHVQAALRALVI